MREQIDSAGAEEEAPHQRLLRWRISAAGADPEQS